MHRWTGILLLAGAASALPAAPAAEARELPGWTRRADGEASPGACAVDLPRLPVRQAVTTMLQQPADLPRPLIRCEPTADPVAVPLAADPMLLERVEGEEPTLSWTPRLAAQPRGGGALIVDVDVKPWRPLPGPDSLAARPPVPQPLAPAPAMRHYEPPRFRPDPTRPGASDPEPASLRPQVVPPALSARRIEGIDSDVLAIASGGAWLAVDLAIERGRLSWYRVSEAEIWGLPGRLIVAPTPQHPRSVLEIFAIDPMTAAPSSLGRPAAAGASWRQELSDIREREGHVEALLIVRSATARAGMDGPVHGALLRREAGGAQGGAGGWRQVTALPLPGDVLPRSLRFDAVDPRVLVLSADGATWVHRRP